MARPGFLRTRPAPRHESSINWAPDRRSYRPLSLGLGLAGGATVSGFTVTAESALTFAAVWACINCISSDIAALPLHLYATRPDGGRDRVVDDPRADLVGITPDEETTAQRFRQTQLVDALSWGNAYAAIDRSRWDGSPLALRRLDPARTRPVRSRDRRLWYESDGDPTRPAADVIHLAGLSTDGLNGRSPIAYARDAIALGKSAEVFGEAYFGNGSRPSGALTHPAKLDDDVKSALREGWDRMNCGPESAGRVVILDNGLDWKPFTIPNTEAQFLETRKFQTLEIARFYRVPPNKIGDYSEAHQANVEESNLDYIVTCLLTWAVAIEQAHNVKLFFRDERRRLYLEHDFRGLLRGNMLARAEFYAKLAALGVLSPNVIARLENLNPIGPAGDLHLVPLNLAPIESYARTPAADPSGAHEPPDLSPIATNPDPVADDAPA